MVTSKNCDVLLTYAWCRTSYVALRSLTRLGLKLAVADVGQVGMCQWSRFTTRVCAYASFLSQPEAFVDDIVRLLGETGARFLLPAHDETELLARHRQRLPSHVVLPVADYEKLSFANDKARTASLASRLGLPVPHSITWSEFAGLESALQSVNFPLVVKLRRSNSAKGVFYPASSAEALQLCRALVEKYHLPPERYPLLQERVEGEGWGVSCLYWQGERLASFTHRRLREKTATGGTSTLRISTRNPVLEQIAHRLLDEIGWHGLAMVEFKFNPATRQGWFIEINPRLWGSIHLAVASGVDFPALLYRAAIEGPQKARPFVQEQREGLVARWYLGDAISAVSALLQKHPLRALRLLLPGGADTLDDWYWDDPGAFLGQAAYYLITFLKTHSLNPEQEGMLG